MKKVDTLKGGLRAVGVAVLLLTLLLISHLAAQAQTPGVGIGTTAPDASAALDIVSSTKGALLPRVADATALASPATGLLVFQTNSPAGYYYNAGDAATPNWQQLATASGAAVTASNGLTKTGQNIALGGVLTGATSIDQAGNSFSLTGGNVGIGTTAPFTQLTNVSAADNIIGTDLNGVGSQSLNWVNTGSGYAGAFYNSSAGGAANGLAVKVGGLNGVALDVSEGTAAGTAGTSLLRVNGNGTVGIGTTSPTSTLDVNGSTRLRWLTTAGVVTTDASGNLTSSTALTAFGDNFIQNGSSQQPASFNVSGNGTIGNNLGVGTATPVTQLANSASNIIGSDVNGVGGQALNWVNASNGYAGAFFNSNTGGAGNGLAVKVASTTGVAFDVSQNAAVGTAGTPLLRVNGNGKVGIGIGSAATQALDVNGTARLRTLGAGVVSAAADGTLSSSSATTAFGTSFIQNGTSPQASSSFNISGSGTIGGNNTVSGNQAVTGTSTVGGLLTATGGATVTGAININTSGAAATSIGTGTGTGNTSVGNGAGTLGLTGASIGLTGATTVTGTTAINTNGTAATSIGTGSTAGAITIGRSGGTVTVPKLTTAGVVTTDASGNLSSATAASLDATTASNGLSKTGVNLTMGGTLTGATTIAQGGNTFSLTGGSVGIGTVAPSQTLDVNGGLRVRGLAGTGSRLPMVQADGTLAINAPVFTTDPVLGPPTTATGSVTTGGGSTPISVAVSGTRAYVVNQSTNTLQVFDVTTASAPALLGSIGTGASSQPRSVAVSGTKAYVVNQNTNTLQIYDVTTASAPSLLGSIGTGASSNPISVAVSGTRAYVVNISSSTLQVYDVSTPATPTLLGSIGTDAQPLALAVSGTRAYMGTLNSSLLQVFDVAMPSAITLLGAASSPGGTPSGVAVSGTHAYVVNQGNDTFQTFDVSGTTPVLLNSLATGSGLQGVAVSGTRAYVVSGNTNLLQTFDVSATTPVLLASATTGSNPYAVAASGTTAYVVNNTANTLQVFAGTPSRVVQVNTDGSFASVASPTLSVSGQSLSIAGGNTVALPDPTTASNGLTKTGSNTVLGGTLTQATTIAQGGNTFSLMGGNVGIGTSAPFTQLTNVPTASNIIGSDGNGVGSQALNWVNTSNGYAGAFYNTTNNLTGDGLAVKILNTSAVAFDVSQGATASGTGTALLRVNGNGNVGVDTNNPTSALYVNGAVSMPYIVATATTFALTNAHQTVRRNGTCNTITLPDASTCLGRLYTIINSNGTGSNVALTVTSGGGIYDDAAPNGTGGTVGAGITALAPNNRLTVQSDGSGWIVVGR